MQDKTPIRVAIVEDDPRFLEGLTQLLENTDSIHVAGSYSRGKEGIEGVTAQNPDVVLLDLGLPDISGIDFIKNLSSCCCATEAIVLTVFDDDAHLFAAMRFGAVGYIVKNEVSLKEIVRAIEEVIDGGSPMSGSIARRVLEAFRRPPRKRWSSRLQVLTNREREILDHLGGGLGARKIEEVLHISYATVRTHQKNIYRKLQVNSLVEAVAVLRG